MDMLESMTQISRSILKSMKREGENTIFVFRNQLYTYLQHDVGFKNYLKRFNELKSNSEQVEMLYKSLKKYNLLVDKFQQDEKNDKKANEYKEKGNKHFAEGKYEKALRCYTKTLMRAKSEDIVAIAYANRSAALYKLELYNECLTDIERAFSNNYPTHLKPKLIKRKVQASKLLKKSKSLLKYEKLPTIPLNHRNPVINCASNCIEVKSGEDSKRHVFATRDIEIGEVIAVETPFSATVAEGFYYHCHECFELCYNPISCPNCSQVLYCGEECKNHAWTKYHKDECSILLSLRQLVGRNKSFLLGIKMAFLIRDENADEVLNLIKDTKVNSYFEQFDMALVAAFMYGLVKAHTKKFEGENGAHLEKVFKESLITYMHLSLMKASSVDELSPCGEDREELQVIAMGIYPFYTLFNHSCYPNVFGHHYGLKRVLRAIKTIKKGQECCVSFGPFYVETSKKERQRCLDFEFGITCKCRACEEDWSEFDSHVYYDLTLEDIISTCMIRSDNMDLVKHTISKKIHQLKTLEHLEPNSEFSFHQVVLMRCFNILGNKRMIP